MIDFVFAFVFVLLQLHVWKFLGWGPIGAAAAGLHHNHSNAGLKPHLRHMPQLVAVLDP